MTKISVVVNTWNEEKNIGRCLESVKDFADEIVVVDMESEDKTVAIAKKFGAKVFSHKLTYYVEPARNFALSKATGDWILVLDADEELSKSLAKELKRITRESKVDYVEIPRKDIIFGQWIKYSRWWPHYYVRFFKRGKVKWGDKIHRPPETKGIGEKFEAKEENALIHYHYENISQYIERLDRYTNIQVENLIAGGYKFKWADLIRKPTDEFLSRFFFGEGYKDGLHGLVLGILQAFSEFVLYLKVWEKEGFLGQERILSEFNTEVKQLIKNLKFWQRQAAVKEASFFKKPFLKLRNKILK